MLEITPQHVLASINDPIFIKDSEHRWVYANQAFINLLGRSFEDYLGKTDSDFFPHEMCEHFWREDNHVLKTGLESHLEEEVIDGAGLTHRILTRKNRIQFQDHYYVLGVIRDVTGLSHSTRLDHLSELSGGLAHELLTPITVLDYNIRKAQMLLEKEKMDVAATMELIKRLEMIQRRLMGTVNGVHSFARQLREVKATPVTLKELFMEVQELVKPRLEKRNAQLILGDIPHLYVASKGPQLSQVLVNLVHNAADAVANLPERWIKIETVTHDGHVEIKVIDAGDGIPRDVASKLMQPFFSTKSGEEGTGLGLALASRMVRDHDGDLFYDTHSQKTTFVLRLPSLDE